ncbi:MAG: 50S ribosomal protein L1 [Spirochaetes bacterium]|nr:50S ribosomal protein L1 [Spirochaetota bacterium]
MPKVKKIGSKRYSKAHATIDRKKTYSVDEAIALVKQNAGAKFDETIEAVVNLNLLSKHSIRDTISFKHGFGKEKRVLVFARGDKADEATKAGADFVGAEDLMEKIKGGWVDFDVAISTPDLMKDVGKLGQVLGKRGLMPNPKTGTVTMNLESTVKAFKKGRVEYRAEKAGIVHMAVGKASMAADALKDNFLMFYEDVMKKRPSDIKGDYVRKVCLTSTMGPGLKIDFKKLK